MTINVVEQKINQNRAAIQAELHKTFGYPVSFNKIETVWRGFSLGVNLTEVKAYDDSDASKGQVVFLSIDDLELQAPLIQWLFYERPDFNPIFISGLKLTLGFVDEKPEVMGLEGEYIPGEIDYKSLLSAFDKKEIILKKSEIRWRTKDKTIIQRFSGELKSDPQKKLLTFTGRQRFREDTFLNSFLKSNVAFSLNTETDAIDFSMDLNKLFQTQSDAKLECRLDEKKFLSCHALANNFDLAPLHQNIELSEQDPAWLIWLTSALEGGKITKGLLAIDGKLDHLQWQGEIHYEDVNFRYYRQWPKIVDASGKVNIKDNAVFIQMDNGNIEGAKIQGAKAIVGPLVKLKKPNKEKEEMMRVTIEGKVIGTLQQGAEFLKNSPLEKAKSQLVPINPIGPMDLTIKLDIPLEEKPKMTSLTVDGNIATQDASLFIPDLKLPIRQITGHFGFTEKGLSAKNIKATIFDRQVLAEIDPTKIETSLDFAVNELKKEFEFPWLTYFKGGSLFKVRFLQEENTIQVESDLKGIAIDLPKPLGKSQDTLKPMVLSIYPLQQNERKFSLFIKDLLEAKWKVTGGKTKETEYQIKVDNPEMKGNIQFTQGTQGKSSALKMDFQRLIIKEGIIKEGTIKEGTEFNQDLSYFHTNKIPVQFSCQNLMINKQHFGDTSFYLKPVVDGYAIQDLQIKNNAFLLEGSGAWKFYGKYSNTWLKGEVFCSDLGQSLSEWGFSSSMKEGNGRVQFNLSWPKNPLQFSLVSSTGTAGIHMKSGRILGVNPGLGRILGLLSLENIYRRLKMDFNDLYSQGFEFDSLAGDFNFQNGIAQTNNLKINGPAANVSIAGEVMLESKNVNLNMTVTPKMGGGMSLVAGLATGIPAVGVGVWAFDKMLGSKINLMSKKYQVTGTWDNPKLNEGGK